MKVAIVGFGFMGGMHAQIYHALPGVELVAVADLFVEATKTKLASLGLGASVYPDLGTLLQAVDVDVVDICSPTDQHEALAIMAAKAGKHLFIEKPLALTMEGCAQIEAAVNQAGVFAQVGHCIRFWPEYQALEKYIKSEQAGPLKSLSLLRRSPRPGTNNPEHWVHDVTRCGGGALDLHIHDTDFVLHLLGSPQAVVSSTTTGRSGPDHIFTHYQFDHVAVQAEGGWDYPTHYGFRMAFEAIFEDAVIRYDSSATPMLQLIAADQAPVALKVEMPSSVGTSKTGEGNIASLGGYYNELKYFVTCLQAGHAPKTVTIAQARESVRVLLAELESASTGTSVSL